jgi:DMSO/TMAO reductase YedYZ molybdopterin-dependent catalytic subunit
MDRRTFLLTLGRAGMGVTVCGLLPRPGPSAAAKSPPELIERNAWPEHFETTLEALGRSWITRNDRFFVRSHLPAPAVDPAPYRLEVTGWVRRPLALSLAEVKALPTIESTHTLECAGNGRALYKLPSTSGTQWGHGGVGNAAWTGTRLSFLLQRAELLPEARHVWFEAADRAPLPDVPPFLRSIPLDKAMADVLLAHGMNDEPLPALHGAPLRAVVPGWYGMASTKWVTRIRVEPGPSENHFMARGYRYVYPGEDPGLAPPVEEMKVKSVITRPLEGARVRPVVVRPADLRVRIQGFAWAGPQGVRLVEVSSDGGRTWKPAGFMGETAPGAWRAWATELAVQPPARLTVMARATDGRGEAQPLEARANAAGYANNSIHAVSFRVQA